MGKCRCKRCGNILIRGEDHPCFIHKKIDYRYSIQQEAKSDDNLDDGNDKSTESSNDNSQNLSRAFGRNESKRSLLRSLLLFQNNERNKSTNSAGSSNYSQPRNPSDSSYFHPISDFQAIQVQTNQNVSFTASSENAESNNRHENDCIETYNREQAAAGSRGIDIQNLRGSGVSDHLHAKPDEECKMSLEDSKSQSLKKDKNYFVDDLEYIRNALTDNNNIFGTANSTENRDLPPGDYEPKNCKMQVSQCVNDEHISPEVPSQVHTKKTKVATFVKEPRSTKKDDNAVAGPSGLCARKKKFPKTYSRKDTFKPNYQTHTGNEPFMCNICKKKFSKKSDFDRHYIMHTGEKPYECAICEEKFSWKSCLIIHYRLHSGEKPYVCEFCNKGFAQKSNLKIHVRTHTGERPYKCPSCEESFINSSNCKKHHKRKHE
ncbi:zinc finger protein 569-like [Argiope bruennichi]|uniref:Zinc finger protein 771 like protein n=1 Tax=Argiope bruennichi TaxID=94029 RepID=A0A8T0FFX9_ARGBR|nr:zinc finger protein 569-like [Argiope bruennichi]KAF8788200.1 Zinc finger protein 771 like protein [Argiope bruennichi]